MKNYYSNIRIIFIFGKSPNRIFTANIQYNLFKYSNNSNIRPNTGLEDIGGEALGLESYLDLDLVTGPCYTHALNFSCLH